MRLVIVGGVAGGMSCAARARRLDENADIIVLDQGKYVSFANCGLPYYVGGEIEDAGSLLLHTPDSLRGWLNLDVRTEYRVSAVDYAAHELTVETPNGTEIIGYDVLVLSPGGEAALPPVPGLAEARDAGAAVHTLRTVDDARALRALAESGGAAVVIGGGFIGMEAAEALANQGLETHVVETAEHILPPLEREMATLATDEAERLGIKVHAATGAQQVEYRAGNTESPLNVRLSNGETLEADLVVVSAGVKPLTSVFTEAGVAAERGAIIIDEHGRTNIENVYAVGDATLSRNAVTGVPGVVALAGPANRAGRLVADHIFRGNTADNPARPIPASEGTAIVRIGDLAAAMTGANRAQLDAAGVTYKTIHLHPNQHAGYFPGAKPIHLIIHFETPGGRLLGAQAIAEDGADKRIDVLATAIRAGMSVRDLIDLDLSYSPPYGNAKDAINMAGLVGSNVLDGVLELMYPEQVTDLGEDWAVLDVRSEREFGLGHLPDAINIPHTELRERLPELAELVGEPGTPGAKKLAVMCAVGVRAWIAYQVVRQAGWDGRMISGGINTLYEWYGPQIADLLEI
ncbi:MAG: FAD-dependent oxidoreductase [Varibaculum sp.]|nr:FAD-dependent oxidoreductase [Varibaculum sp.]